MANVQEMIGAVKERLKEFAAEAGIAPSRALGVQKMAEEVCQTERNWPTGETATPRFVMPTAAEPGEIEVPAGWTLMPAGQARRMRVNKDFLKGDDKICPWLIADIDGEGFEDAPFFISEAKFLGPVTTGTIKLEHPVVWCGQTTVKTEWRAFVESSGPVLVR